MKGLEVACLWDVKVSELPRDKSGGSSPSAKNNILLRTSVSSASYRCLLNGREQQISTWLREIYLNPPFKIGIISIAVETIVTIVNNGGA